MQLQINSSTAAGMHLSGSQTNPAAVTNLANAQPSAAPDSATLAAAAAAPQLGRRNSYEPAMQDDPTDAAVLRDSNSYAQETSVPTNPAGIVPSPTHSSEDILRDVNPSAQATAVSANSVGIVTTPTPRGENMQGQVPAEQPAEETRKQNMPLGMTPGASVARSSPGRTEGSDQPAGGVQHVGEPVRGLADPNKRLLAKMGSQAPADVSKQLLQEVAARAHVETLLQVSTEQAKAGNPSPPASLHPSNLVKPREA